MPSELYTFVLYLLPSEIRSRGFSTEMEVMSEVAAREHTWKTCHTNAEPSLLGCYSCCCYGNKVCGCCGTIINPPNAVMESFLSICTQYTLCKYVALTFTEPWFYFLFSSLVSALGQPRSWTQKAQHLWNKAWQCHGTMSSSLKECHYLQSISFIFSALA